jgi:hypothetical protein
MRTKGESVEAKDATRALVLGIIIGALGGLLLGSIVALGLGPHAGNLLSHLVARRQRQLRFDLFLQ